jgi:GDPmannose 4,6-dehydratase
MRALITGAAGQDGTILATLLAREGAHVIGLVKPGSDAALLRRYAPATEVIECDLADSDALHHIARDTSPQEIYNLGGWSTPGNSWGNEELVDRVNVDAVRALLAALTELPGARLFQASSASVFEGADAIPQTERTWLAPKSPYGQSKARAMELINQARSDNQLFAVSGVFYNHESPLRGGGFVTRRISMAVARIAAGLQDVVELGDIEVARDWGWAPDYVRAAMLMLRADVPHDYVLATGISHRLSFFLGKAFAAAGISDWHQHVVTSQDRTRLSDTNMLVGDSRAAYTELGWRHSVDFDTMAGIMVKHDMALLKDPSSLWTDF